MHIKVDKIMTDLPPSRGSEEHESWFFSCTGIVTDCALAILGFLVYEGHGAHLLGAAPHLLLLACPLMHIFMHDRHGSSHHICSNPDDTHDNKNPAYGLWGCRRWAAVMPRFVGNLFYHAASAQQLDA